MAKVEMQTSPIAFTFLHHFLLDSAAAANNWSYFSVSSDLNVRYVILPNKVD